MADKATNSVLAILDDQPQFPHYPRRDCPHNEGCITLMQALALQRGDEVICQCCGGFIQPPKK